jgi:NAD-dependent deacetylase
VLDAVARAVADARTPVAFAGAGVSTASGVPSFRGADGVRGDAVDPAEFDRSRLDRDPAGFWRDRALHGRMYAADPEPNATHEALAAVERAGHLDAVVTQNVDGRHGAAGSTTVDRHGNGSRVVPERCGERAPAGLARETPRAGDVPRCDCGGLRRPDVVLFGETLPDGALERAQSLAIRAGAFLAVGSSLSVEPAASLPRLAARTGTLVVVHLDPTPLDSLADHVLRADVVEVLPAVASGLAAGVGDGNGAGDGG